MSDTTSTQSPVQRAIHWFLFEPGGTDPRSPASWGLLVMRLMLGVGMAVHGWQVIGSGNIDKFAGGVEKLGFPAPVLFAWLAKGSELVGGILLAVGALSRPALAFLIGTMLVAVFMAKSGQPFFAGPGEPSREMPMLYLMPFIGLMLTGPGALSLDAWFARKRGAAA